MTRARVKLNLGQLVQALLVSLLVSAGLHLAPVVYAGDDVTRAGSPTENSSARAGQPLVSRSAVASDPDLSHPAKFPARSKPIYFEHSDAENSVPTSIKLGSKLAVQLVVADKRRNSSSLSKPNRVKPSSFQLHRKRPYDIVGTVSGNVISKHQVPLERLFYSLDKQTLDPPANTFELFQHAREREQAARSTSTTSTTSTSTTRLPSPARKSELIRTQHRPPANWNSSRLAAADRESNERQEIIKKLGIRFKQSSSTVAPKLSSSDFFELISSAHSPVSYKFSEAAKPALQPKPTLNPRAAQSVHSRPNLSDQNDDASAGQQPRTTSASLSSSSTTTAAPMLTRYAMSEIKRGPTPPSQTQVSEQADLKDFVSSAAILFDQESPDANNVSPMFNHAEMPTVMFDGKKQVTLIRHVTRRPNASTTTTTLVTRLTPQPVVIVSHQGRPSVLADSGSDLQEPAEHISLPVAPQHITMAGLPEHITMPAPPEHITIPATPPTTTAPLVRLISKHKHKYDDNVKSPTLTVVDSHAIRVPPNATSVHNNKLIVAIRPGRPMRPAPPTTQFPVYNIVAGITPPYISTPTPHFSRPLTIEGANYGLLKPNASSVQTTPMPSSFGAQNIKFPAPAPSNLVVQHADYPSRFNLSVPDSARPVGPNGVPDKILVNTGEQYLRPPDAIAISDSTIVSRPAGSITINNDGVEKLSTTRKPLRFSTTKRINIVSANTTVITTDPEELHEMLNGVIAGSHTQHNITTSNKPTPRPGFFAYVSNIFTNSFTTTLIAALTIIKTILVAILVMFLPPLALASAIMQAVSLG